MLAVLGLGATISDPPRLSAQANTGPCPQQPANRPASRALSIPRRLLGRRHCSIANADPATPAPTAARALPAVRATSKRHPGLRHVRCASMGRSAWAQQRGAVRAQAASSKAEPGAVSVPGPALKTLGHLQVCGGGVGMGLGLRSRGLGSGAWDIGGLHACAQMNFRRRLPMQTKP